MRNVMRKLSVGIAVTGVAVIGVAGPTAAAPPDCNWGQLTADAIADGFEQGPHASSQATPRAGLANLDPSATGRDKLQFTCELIDDLLNGA